MADILRQAVEQALGEDDATLDGRLVQAVIAKHRQVFALVRGSAHAAELFSFKDTIAGDIFAALDAAILGLLAAAMAEDPQLSLNAERLARAIYLGGIELAQRSPTMDAMATEIEAFVATLLAGARAIKGRDK